MPGSHFSGPFCAVVQPGFGMQWNAEQYLSIGNRRFSNTRSPLLADARVQRVVIAKSSPGDRHFSQLPLASTITVVDVSVLAGLQALPAPVVVR